MSTYSAAFRSNGAGSATLPLGSLYAPAGNRLILKEVHVFNTTATAVAVVLRAFTATGTQGSGITEVEHDPGSPPPLGTVFDTHTVTPTITAGSLAQAQLAAAVGGGVVWIFNNGIVIPTGVGNGVGVLSVGTGQLCDLTFIWEE